MNKPTALLYGPVDTFSGYGGAARDRFKAIIELKKDEWDIKIISCNWGNTPMGFIEQNPEYEFFKPYITTSTQITSQPDYMFWCTIPSEAQKIGKFNVLFTAGIESTLAPAEWVEGCSRMDLVLGSSSHTIDILRNSKFQKIDKNTNQQVGIIEWNGKGDVLFEGYNEEIYNKNSLSNTLDLSNIKENFCFLFTGHWIGNTPIGEDRKNVGLLIKAFYETFKNKPNKPALILKTSTYSSSYMDRDEILNRIKQIQSTVKSTNLPNIYLLHGDLMDKEMNELYNHPKVKAMISLTKGEGFGRPLLEFSTTGKPIITTNWSGHIDFLKPEFNTLLGGELKEIHPAATNNFLMKEAKWMNVNTMEVGESLVNVFKNYSKQLIKSSNQQTYTEQNFTYSKMKDKLSNIINEFPKFSQQVQLKLPPMRKMELPKLLKIE
jgi:hypothetical protein